MCTDSQQELYDCHPFDTALRRNLAQVLPETKLSELLHFEPLEPGKGVTWQTAAQCLDWSCTVLRACSLVHKTRGLKSICKVLFSARLLRKDPTLHQSYMSRLQGMSCMMHPPPRTHPFLSRCWGARCRVNGTNRGMSFRPQDLTKKQLHEGS